MRCWWPGAARCSPSHHLPAVASSWSSCRKSAATSATPKFADLIRLIQVVLTEHHGIQADSIILMQSVRIPTTPDGTIQRSACRDQYLDGDLDTLAQWHAPDPAGEVGDANVVELIEDVMTRPRRASQ
jgi:hypothetical protein